MRPVTVTAPGDAPPEVGPPAGLPRLNVGCGHVQPPGWVNIDGSNRAAFASRLWWLDALLVRLRLLPPTEFNRHTRTDDLTKRLRYRDNTVAAIYGGEMLEHLTREQGRH